MERNDDKNRNTVHDTGAPKTDNILHHDDNPGVGDLVGEGVGGVSGMMTGMAIGAIGGPIGAIIGGIAGTVGGWWAGRTVSEAATHMTGGDADNHYREHYEKSSTRLADRGYDDVRPAYQLGHLAGMNPEYKGREFDAVESDLQRGWNNDIGAKHGEWTSVRGYARDAFTRSRSTMGAAAGTTGAAVAGAGNAVADAADDMKDRVDGNPASKPGVDSTDSPRRM